MGEYLLGTSDHELARMTLQQEVWGERTRAVLDLVPLDPDGPGGPPRVLDAGCGPGLVTDELRRRVGPAGSVVAVDESPRWIAHLRERAAAEGWSNVEAAEARLERLDLPPASFDLVFLRWVLDFVGEPDAVLAGAARVLKPGGAVLVMDYNHAGVSIFPESDGFDAAVRACRDAYVAHGGDSFRMGRIPRLFRAAGLEPERFEPHLIAGTTGSAAHRWMDAFFPFHTERWVASGHMTAAERERFLADWTERAGDPDATFFSPIVVGASARKPR